MTDSSEYEVVQDYLGGRLLLENSTAYQFMSTKEFSIHDVGTTKRGVRTLRKSVHFFLCNTAPASSQTDRFSLCSPEVMRIWRHFLGEPHIKQVFVSEHSHLERYMRTITALEIEPAQLLCAKYHSIQFD